MVCAPTGGLLSGNVIDGDGPLAVTEPVVMEVLAGARDDPREADLQRLLLRFRLLRFDATADFEAAARIHRRCRGAGVTPRGMTDWPTTLTSIASRGSSGSTSTRRR